MPLRTSAASVAVMMLMLVAGANTQEHQHAAAPEQLGTVVFATSCSAQVQPQFNRAVALLHSFEFLRAIDGFNATLAADSSCAMAEWGIALSRWGNPFAVGIRPAGPLRQGRDAVERARAIGAKSERERAYVDAVARLYLDVETTAQAARVQAYRDGMSRVAATYPDDTEGSIFYALSIAAAASPADKTFADQLKAGAILEGLIARQPDHPGLAHYIIHAYDVPALADRALAAARRYATIAPSAPHALHMPSHTFTRVGDWQASIDTNIASAAAAKRDGSVAEELHAMDYRVYACLQTARDHEARQLLDTLPEVAARFDPAAAGSAAPGSAGLFALAAIPARYALERGAWADAARLEPRPSAFPYTRALTYFARAIGAARIRDTATVRSSIASLQDIEQQLTQANEIYWAQQTQIQRQSASAWLAFAERREADALAAMRAAAALEDSTEKAAVTPGPLAPARELLGDMLLEVEQPAEARKEFEATLTKEPNRFRAVLGAARSASRMGDLPAARRYYDQLLEVSAHADQPGRPELAEARRALGSAPRFKVLAFYTGTSDLAHVSFVREANLWFPEAGRKHGFSYEATNDWTRLNADVLAQYQVVLFLDTRPDDPAGRQAFRKYMENGGAWMGFHFAGFALTPSKYPQDWDWYHNDFIGAGSYVSNSWRPVPAVLRVEAPGHPVLKGLSGTFTSAASEWYRWERDLRTNPDIQILLSIDPSSFPLGTGPKPNEIWHSGYYPVVWTNKRFRMVYMNVGHNDMAYEDKSNRELSSTFASEAQNTLITNALLWLGDRSR